MPTHSVPYLPGVSVTDLFCGVGGLSKGFLQEAFKVNAGIDIDKTCKFAFEANNDAPFLLRDVSDLTSEELASTYKKGDVKVLVGCAPCQPFSSYAFRFEDEGKRWKLLYEFIRLIKETRPEIVSMENVPQLVNYKKAPVFKDFIAFLTEEGYHVSYKVVYSPQYGIPQKRKRLVLLASLIGPIDLIPPTHGEKNYVTVRDTIGELPPVEHGGVDAKDPLHRASRLTDINVTRIKQSRPGGNWKDWDESLRLPCHSKESGKSYGSVYGRMSWDEPSPTITTQAFGLGSGRFGHPEQDRALTLREAALLQTFPADYKFVADGQAIAISTLAKHIGNAVPVHLGRVIARSIKVHLESYGLLNNNAR